MLATGSLQNEAAIWKRTQRLLRLNPCQSPTLQVHFGQLLPLLSHLLQSWLYISGVVAQFKGLIQYLEGVTEENLRDVGLPT
jgi:hypothetical protein